MRAAALAAGAEVKGPAELRIVAVRRFFCLQCHAPAV